MDYLWTIKEKAISLPERNISMAKTKYVSSSASRKISLYLKPQTYMMFKAEMAMKLNGPGLHCLAIVEAHYNAMTPSHQRQLLDYYETNLNPKKNERNNK